MEGEAPARAQILRPMDSNNKYLASVRQSETHNAAPARGAPSVRPHAMKLIAEDPEKARVVGRLTRAAQRSTGASVDPLLEIPPQVEPPQHHASPPEPPPPPVFEGSGLAEVGTLRRQKQQADNDDDDDEFSYALEGGKREEGFHKQVYRPKAMPAHLVSNVKQRLNTEVLAEEEEEEEEEEEGEEEEEQGEEDVDEDPVDDGEDKQQQSRSRDKQQSSWTTFAVSEGHMESLADVSDPAKQFGEAPPAAAAAPTRTNPSTEDLPSYKLMQALHVTNVASAAASTVLVGDHGSPAATGSSTDGLGKFVGGTGPQSHVPVQNDSGANTTGGHAPHGNGMGLVAVGGPATAATAAAVAQPPTGAGGVAAAKAGTHGVGSRLRHEVPAAPPAVVANVPEDEWEAANRERQREQTADTSSVTGTSGPGGSGGPALTYHQALVHFMATDTSGVRMKVAAALPPPPGFLSRMLCLGPPDLKPPQLREQLLQLLALARVPFSDEDPMHVRLLGALYGAFTGKTSDPPRYGSHWAELGFQGQDPATDLRGCGMLGLLQLFYLTQWSPDGANKMLRLSHHPVQEFPLSIVSLNVTKWTLQALRSGQLHRAANARGSSVEAAQQFYAGCMVTFYLTWLNGAKTMAQSGHVLKDLERLALKKTGLMLDAAQRLDLPEPPAGGGA